MEPNREAAPQNSHGAQSFNFPLELKCGSVKVLQQENVCEITSKQMNISCLFKRWSVVIEGEILLG